MPILSHFTAVPAGLTAFAATNMDDIFILLLFFSQVNAIFRNRHIVAGQYLGFAALVLVSLPGFFGSLVLPRAWIGMLGVIPIAIGISRLLNREGDESEEISEEIEAGAFPTSVNSGLVWTSFCSPQTYSVAAITFANGGDNIGIYVPLFANYGWEQLLVILGTFFSLVGVWCYTAYRLSQLPVLAASLNRYGNSLVPYVLICLGGMILVDGHTLEDRGLTVVTLALCCFCLLTLNRNQSEAAILKSDAP